MPIPVLKPAPSGLEEHMVVEALRSGWWGNGPRCREFEELLAKAYARQHAVTVNSATAALHLSCLATGIGPGDEVIVPALTFISTALAVLYCGATPVFADVRPDTLTIDWPAAQLLVTERTKAIIPVDFAGYPAFVARPDTPLTVIQDAAHAPLGPAYGDYICLSFHPVKPIASPDGGAIVLNDDATADRLRRLRWCGIDRDTWQRNGRQYAWRYEVRELGYKSHWNDVAASIALAQLERYDALLARRRALARRYQLALCTCPVGLPVEHYRHQWHLFVIRVAADERDALIDYLTERGISCGVHYEPLTHYALFNQPTPLVAEREWQRLVTLPLYSDMLESEQDQVIQAVREFYD